MGGLLHQCALVTPSPSLKVTPPPLHLWLGQMFQIPPWPHTLPPGLLRK